MVPRKGADVRPALMPALRRCPELTPLRPSRYSLGYAAPGLWHLLIGRVALCAVRSASIVVSRLYTVMLNFVITEFLVIVVSTLREHTRDLRSAYCATRHATSVSIRRMIGRHFVSLTLCSLGLLDTLSPPPAHRPLFFQLPPTHYHLFIIRPLVFLLMLGRTVGPTQRC